MKVTLLDSTKDPAWLISMAARRCYASRSKDTPEGRTSFIKGLIKAGHTSILEHATATFDIDGISRACQNQIVRHRIGCSYCVESMRYVDMSEAEIVVPHKLFMAFPEIVAVMKETKQLYAELVRLGVPKEDARALLPLGTATNMTVTMNFRAIRHFLKLRLSKHAQDEIRQVAYQIYKICQEKWPWLVEDLSYDAL